MLTNYHYEKFILNLSKLSLLVGYLSYKKGDKISQPFLDFHSLLTDFLPHSSVQGLSNRLKYALRCGRLCTEKSLSSTKYLVSEIFGFPASLNSLNILCLTRQTITRHSLSQFYVLPCQFYG